MPLKLLSNTVWISLVSPRRPQATYVSVFKALHSIYNFRLMAHVLRYTRKQRFLHCVLFIGCECTFYCSFKLGTDLSPCPPHLVALRCLVRARTSEVQVHIDCVLTCMATGGGCALSYQDELAKRVEMLEHGLQKNGQDLESKDQELMEAHLALKAQVRRNSISRARLFSQPECLAAYSMASTRLVSLCRAVPPTSKTRPL